MSRLGNGRTGNRMNEVDEEIHGADSRDKVKHCRRNKYEVTLMKF